MNIPEVDCPNCGWQGMEDDLVSSTGLKDDVENICCPHCGEECLDYEGD